MRTLAAIPPFAHECVLVFSSSCSSYRCSSCGSSTNSSCSSSNSSGSSISSSCSNNNENTNRNNSEDDGDDNEDKEEDEFHSNNNNRCYINKHDGAGFKEHTAALSIILLSEHVSAIFPFPCAAKKSTICPSYFRSRERDGGSGAVSRNLDVKQDDNTSGD